MPEPTQLLLGMTEEDRVRDWMIRGLLRRDDLDLRDVRRLQRLLVALRDAGETWSSIGDRLDRTLSVCATRYDRLHRPLSRLAATSAALVTELAPGRVARVTPDPGENLRACRASIQHAGRTANCPVTTWYAGGRLYVELAAAAAVAS